MKKIHLVLCMVLMVGSAQAKEGAIQCANLIYAGMQTSRCFSDQFLSSVQTETAVPTERRFKTVKLSSEDLFEYPFVLVTGEKDFTLTTKERGNLKKYLESGGFLLASAGCSSKDWDRAFRRELKAIFKDASLEKLAMDHPIFRTVHEIEEIQLYKGSSGPEAVLEGLKVNEKTVVVYSPHGLNNTQNTEGCCCCGGNEISNSEELNVNILIYSLLH